MTFNLSLFGLYIHPRMDRGPSCVDRESVYKVRWLHMIC